MGKNEPSKRNARGGISSKSEIYREPDEGAGSETMDKIGELLKYGYTLGEKMNLETTK